MPDQIGCLSKCLKGALRPTTRFGRCSEETSSRFVRAGITQEEVRHELRAESKQHGVYRDSWAAARTIDRHVTSLPLGPKLR